MTEEIKDLLPKDKLDVDRAKAIVKRGYPAVAPILKELMEWVQDGNWPVFHVLAPFLSSIGAPLVPEVKRVLVSDDYEWKMSVLMGIVSRSDEIARAVKDELVVLANAKTPWGLDETAQEILEKIAG